MDQYCDKVENKFKIEKRKSEGDIKSDFSLRKRWLLKE